jgi:hypothetical protein
MPPGLAVDIFLCGVKFPRLASCYAAGPTIG